MANYRGLVTDVQTQQETQKAQILNLKDEAGAHAVVVKKLKDEASKPNIGLIAGLAGVGLAAIAGIGTGFYFWWQKRKAQNAVDKDEGGVLDEERPATAVTAAAPALAAVNTGALGGGGQGRRKRNSRGGGGRLHSRHWQPDFSTFETQSSF
jgi:hypothetical protein